MGRKRTSNKKALNLYIDKDIIEDLKKLELNPSAIFTDAAKKELERQRENKKQEKNND